MPPRSKARWYALLVLLAAMTLLLCLMLLHTYSVKDCIAHVLREVDNIKKEHGVTIDPHIVLAVIKQESKFNPNARGRSGEIGLMQIMPGTAKQISIELGIKKYDLSDRATNIRFGVYWLSRMRKYADTDDPWIFRLAEYNAGLTRVNEWRRAATDKTKSREFIKAITIPSTRLYVRSVQKYAAHYRSRKIFEQYPEPGLR